MSLILFVLLQGAAQPHPALEAAAAEAERSVILQVAERHPAFVANGRLVGSGGAELSGLAAVLAARPVERLFVQDYATLADLRDRALGRGAWPPPPDLNQWFRVRLANAAQAQDLLGALAGVPAVAVAYLQPAPAPPPVDLPPTTPHWTDQQDYFEGAPIGTGQYAVQGVLGARGRGVRITDCEYNWILDHEDLELDSSRLVGGTPVNLWSDHGTAVLGELYAQDNDYGVTGGVPQADIYCATEYATTWGYNPTQAILNAAAASGPGDVILLEMQTGGPTGAYVPEEWTPASFAAIASATALGMHVVEAGGNGYMNLDDPVFNGYFDLAVQDSGAIIVGAGDGSADHRRLSFSSHGSRMDAQGWGGSVYTAGYGWLFEAGSDDRQDYTWGFSGTSSASPIVTAAISAVLGALQAHGMPAPTPLQVRDALRATGTPQDPGDAAANGRIGSLPELEGLLAWFGMPDGLRHPPRAALGTQLAVNLKGGPAQSWELYSAFDSALIATAAGTRVLGNNGLRLLANGTLNGSGQAIYQATVPNNAALQGVEVFTQVLFDRSGSPHLSNGGAVALY